MRVVIAEDSVLFREGLSRLLSEAGYDVVAEVGDADALLAAARELDPDICVVDVRMPPDLDADGARAARTLRAERPGLPVLLLSQHVETRHSVELVARGGFGYLLKDRVLRVGDFLDAVARVAAGGSALDPEVVGALVGPRRTGGLAALTDREREVLALVAEGQSNRGIADALIVSENTAKYHVAQLFNKLGANSRAEAVARAVALGLLSPRR
ncbi:MAG TPA: response regulator transcription factor, partial [Mycobacteriales bacterium]|nr:response regulator transcription factor [Mycobacteriales bacterium]